MSPTHGKVKAVENQDQFHEIIHGAIKDSLIVVDFSASWCGPCNKIFPQIQEMSTNTKYTNVVFLEVDIDHNAELAEKCNIRSMPTFIFYKNGVKVAEFSGANLEKLEQTINRYIS